MAKQIYYLHSCNEWKEYSSMELLFIGTSQQKLKMKISKEIEEGNMEYYDGDLSPKEQAKKFRKDWKTETRATIDKNKILVWCTTNRLITFRDFMQYALDNLKNPKDFMIIDTEKNLVYDMYKVATEIYGMKERTFEEIINDVHTGKWAKYSDDELKGLEKGECKDDYTELFWKNYPTNK